MEEGLLVELPPGQFLLPNRDRLPGLITAGQLAGLLGLRVPNFKAALMADVPSSPGRFLPSP
jgi:hypothetical protein